MLKVGKIYLVQTATGFWMSGQLTEELSDHFVFEKAAWIANTGRFASALRLSEFDEVEPLPRALVIAKQAIVMAVEIEKVQVDQK